MFLDIPVELNTYSDGFEICDRCQHNQFLNLKFKNIFVPLLYGHPLFVR